MQGDATLADGLTGALLAFEGIEDGAVILHGPSGCRGHHCSLSERAFPRDVHPERMNFAEPFYFGQPRIPTTCLDGDDFVFGAADKLRRALATVAARQPGLLAVVNSPGAALIGEDLRRIASEAGLGIPVVTLDMPAISRSLAEGYEQAVLVTFDTLDLKPAPARRSGTVTLVGLSIAHQHWEGSLAELRRLLGLCGIEVICAPGARSPAAAWRRIPEAACHAVVHAEYGERVARRLAERLGGVAVIPQCGAPMGFDATEQWILEVAEAAGSDPSPALAAIRQVRRRVATVLSRVTSLTGAPRGLTAGISADPSTALPLAQFLFEYLSVLPVSVETPSGGGTPWSARLDAALAEMGCREALNVSWQAVSPDLLLADGCQVAQGPAFGLPTQGGIELMLPLSGYVVLVPKALLGAGGAAYLVERIVNAYYGLL
jgi:nitrogenase molybdenum-iron protein alpha/beta subunit